MQETKLWSYEEIYCPNNNKAGHFYDDDIDMCSHCHGTGKIKTDYLIIDSPVLAALFFEESFTFILYEQGGNRIFDNCDLHPHDIDYLARKMGCLKFHFTTVNKVIIENPLAELLFHYGLSEQEIIEFDEWRGK